MNVLYDIIILITFGITITLFIGVVKVFPEQIKFIDASVSYDDTSRDKKWLKKYVSYTIAAFVIQLLTENVAYAMCLLDSVTDDKVAPYFLLSAYMSAVTAGIIFLMSFCFRIYKYKIKWPNIWYSNGVGFCGFFYGVPLGISVVLSLYVFTYVFIL